MAKKIIKKSVCSTAAVVGIFAFLLLLGLAGNIDIEVADPGSMYPAMYVAIGIMAVCILIVNALSEK